MCESEKLRQRGRQGTVAEHGCSLKTSNKPGYEPVSHLRRQNKRTGKINQIQILTWVLTADSFGGFGAEGFSCLLVFGHYKPKKLHSVSYAAVLEFQLHEGGNAAWVFPCVGMVGVSCGLWCIQYSRVSLRSGWYFYSDHNGCNRFLDLPAGYKSSRTLLALLMWSRQ